MLRHLLCNRANKGLIRNYMVDHDYNCISLPRRAHPTATGVPQGSDHLSYPFYTNELLIHAGVMLVTVEWAEPHARNVAASGLVAPVVCQLTHSKLSALIKSSSACVPTHFNEPKSLRGVSPSTCCLYMSYSRMRHPLGSIKPYVKTFPGYTYQ